MKMVLSPRIQIILAASLLSVSGVIIKGCSFSGWQVASFRAGVAALVLLAFMPGIRRQLNWRTLVVGVGYSGILILFVAANKLTTAANAIFLQDTAPLYLVLLGPLLLGEKNRRQEVLFMIAMVAGLTMFFFGGDPPVASAPDPAMGNLLGALGGIFWALTLLGMRWLSMNPSATRDSAPAAIMCGCIIACLATLPWALPVIDPKPVDWLLVAFLGMFAIAFAFMLLSAGMKEVSSLEAALILLLEPVLSPIWVWLAYGERPSYWALIGGGIILFATVIKTWWESRSRYQLKTNLADQGTLTPDATKS
jgi:drug/metabolite transporter (DMT)-like permease